MRKSTKKSLTRKLDKICSEIVRSRGYCAWCHSTENLQCCHIMSRRYRTVRWDMDNLICLCAKHHFYTHSKPILFAEFIKDYLGEEKYSQLIMKSTMIKKFSLNEMQDLLQLLTQK